MVALAQPAVGRAGQGSGAWWLRPRMDRGLAQPAAPPSPELAWAPSRAPRAVAGRAEFSGLDRNRSSRRETTREGVGGSHASDDRPEVWRFEPHPPIIGAHRSLFQEGFPVADPAPASQAAGSNC